MKDLGLKMLFTCALFVGASTIAYAGLISGAQTTADGKTVALQGFEWMSLDLTVGLSRTDIEDGFTDNDGSDWDANEWSYATIDQTATLLNSLWGGVYEGYSHDNVDGTSWFMANFGELLNVDSSSTYTGLARSMFFYGGDGECALYGNNYSCEGMVEQMDSYEVSYFSEKVSGGGGMSYDPLTDSGLGFISQEWGAKFTHPLTYISTVQPYEFMSTSSGSLLIRAPIEVPEPSTLAIFALGMIGLASRRLKKQN